MTKFKQPILFQSRVIDLEEIKQYMDKALVEDLNGEGFFSPAHYLAAYDLAAGYNDSHFSFVDFMKIHFDIAINKLKYGRLPRPMALDARTGELYQAISVDYSSTGIVTSIIAREGDHIKYVYNDLPQTSHIQEERKKDLVMLHDGWY